MYFPNTLLCQEFLAYSFRSKGTAKGFTSFNSWWKGSYVDRSKDKSWLKLLMAKLLKHNIYCSLIGRFYSQWEGGPPMIFNQWDNSKSHTCKCHSSLVSVMTCLLVGQHITLPPAIEGSKTFSFYTLKTSDFGVVYGFLLINLIWSILFFNYSNWVCFLLSTNQAYLPFVGILHQKMLKVIFFWSLCSVEEIICLRLSYIWGIFCWYDDEFNCPEWSELQLIAIQR